jgi:hypothetical protein
MKPKAGNSQSRKLSTGVAIALNKIGFTKGKICIVCRDSTQPVDLYVFVPALRRSLRLSTTARCSPAFGSDFVYDDTRLGAFNGSFTMFDGKFIRDQKNSRSGRLQRKGRRDSDECRLLFFSHMVVQTFA